ncbi:hypothetical protein IF1G_04067 [Cordyceps javanica]|uniref:Uncharacterized protein n=1 Tax=Cordyceps javanica TaxID=43265 RepID=A0A545V534_9HYPO|nr:hypothetical protein IF1G_04067 [Cordyceps javanica]
MQFAWAGELWKVGMMEQGVWSMEQLAWTLAHWTLFGAAFAPQGDIREKHANSAGRVAWRVCLWHHHVAVLNIYLPRQVPRYLVYLLHTYVICTRHVTQYTMCRAAFDILQGAIYSVPEVFYRYLTYWYYNLNLPCQPPTFYSFIPPLLAKAKKKS